MIMINVQKKVCIYIHRTFVEQLYINDYDKMGAVRAIDVHVHKTPGCVTIT